MFNNIEQKNSTKWWRLQNMELMKLCLERYKETKEEFYLENAKQFAEWSRKFKEMVEGL